MCARENEVVRGVGEAGRGTPREIAVSVRVLGSRSSARNEVHVEEGVVDEKECVTVQRKWQLQLLL